MDVFLELCSADYMQMHVIYFLSTPLADPKKHFIAFFGSVQAFSDFFAGQNHLPGQLRISLSQILN